MNNYNDHKQAFHENGNIRTESYVLNGQHHRTDGPAVINYSEDGNISSEVYYLNNERIFVNSAKEFKRYIYTLILK